MLDRQPQELGKCGEDAACEELRRRGYAILARRFRTRVGELDIIARDGQTLVFVEVKARSSARFGLPTEAVTCQKQRRITRMAKEFVSRAQLTRVPCRFDVVSVKWQPTGEPHIDVFPAAFEARD